jgi:hypothetical protein
VLAVVRERIEKIVVDDQRLYWSGSQVPRNANEARVWFLRSCQKRNCASTLVTYGVQSNISTFIFGVSEGQIYWHDKGMVLACPIAGCGGPPQPLASELKFDVATFDGARFYFSTLLSFHGLSLTQPDEPQPLASLPDHAQFVAIAVYDAYVYGLAAGRGSVTNDKNGSLLVRALKDGTAGFETIASDVRYSRERGFGLATDATSIYWTDNLLTGSINRCPLTGCSDESEVVLSSLRAPRTLQIDESELYYVYESQPYRYALASCTLPACASSSPLIEQLDAPEALAMDDEYLYVATTEQDVNPSNFTENTVASIRRLPKPRRGLP